MYGIDGRKDLTEHTLDHLSGWRNSRPVRVGNGAWDQHQNDVWGMLLDAVDIHLRQGASQIVKPMWEGLATMVEAAIAHAGDPDQGIWEIRGDPEHFTASKVLCWVAMDRGADMARVRQEPDRAEAWRKAADELKAEILDKGVDSQGRFRQHYGNEELDASLLLIPILGLPAARRRAGAGHRARHRRRADRGRAGPPLQGGHDRHRASRARRGPSPSARSGWSPRLAMIGEQERARALCQKLLNFAGPLQLYAEEIDASTGEHLGNFPQAFTHLALIDAVGRLIEAEEATDGHASTGREQTTIPRRSELPVIRRGGRGRARRAPGEHDYSSGAPCRRRGGRLRRPARNQTAGPLPRHRRSR